MKKHAMIAVVVAGAMAGCAANHSFTAGHEAKDRVSVLQKGDRFTAVKIVEAEPGKITLAGITRKERDPANVRRGGPAGDRPGLRFTITLTVQELRLFWVDPDESAGAGAVVRFLPMPEVRFQRGAKAPERFQIVWIALEREAPPHLEKESYAVHDGGSIWLDTGFPFDATSITPHGDVHDTIAPSSSLLSPSFRPMP
jgi:hypothetical protein